MKLSYNDNDATESESKEYVEDPYINFFKRENSPTQSSEVSQTKPRKLKISANVVDSYKRILEQIEKKEIAEWLKNLFKQIKAPPTQYVIPKSTLHGVWGVPG